MRNLTTRKMLDQGKMSWIESTKKFLGLQDDLPLHGNAPKNGNGVKGIPTVDRWVALTVFWTVLFLGLMGFGVYHCRSNSYVYSVSCYKSDCSFKFDDKRLGTSNLINFQRSDFLDAERIRIDEKGEYVDPNKVRLEPKRFFGYSIRLKLRLPPEPNARMKIEKLITLAPYNMSKRISGSQVKKIREGLSKETVDFDVSKSSNVTTIGILSITLGFLGCLMVCLFGQWAEHNPRKLKKMS